MKCPACGKETQGRFCSHCGTPLQTGECPECGSHLTPGSRFCTQCGTRVSGTATPRRNIPNLGWYIAAGVLALLILAIGIEMAFGNRDQAPVATGVPLSGAPATTGGDGAPGPLTGTPREQADRLFNRIMAARESGDTAEVNLFMPMALQAYRGIELDNDGLYHLAMLETASGDAQAGLATARRMLESNPDHLLALATAAEAATRLGERQAARQYWQHYLDVFGKEKGKTLQEYLDHQRILPEYEAAARKALAQ